MIKKITTERIEEMGSDSLSVFGGTYIGGVHLMQTPCEIVDCINEMITVGGTFDNYLEVGAAAGGTTFLFNEVFKFKKIRIIDDNQHIKHIFRPGILDNIRKEYKTDIKEYIGNSQSDEGLIFAKDLKYDIILIDADHTYHGVKIDFGLYSQILAPGGFIVLHDIAYDFGSVIINGVKPLLEEIKDEYVIKKFIDETRSNPIGVGLLQKK